MSNAAPIVTIFGGSGFVGRYIAQRMARAGWRVRVAVRRPNEALFVRHLRRRGQVEPIQANIRDEASTRARDRRRERGGELRRHPGQSGKQSFDAVQAEGAGRIARIAAEEGVARLVHVSAIGADAESDSALCAQQGRGRGGGDARPFPAP